MCFPLVKICEEVFGKLQSEGDEVIERVEDLVVQAFGEGFDLGLLLLKKGGKRLSNLAVVC